MDPHIPPDSQSAKDAHKELRFNFSKNIIKKNKEERVYALTEGSAHFLTR